MYMVNEKKIIGINATISPETVQDVADILRDNGTSDEVNMALSSPGGYISSAFNLVRLIRQYASKRFNIYIIDRAKSAATFLCLGATKLYLSDIGELGPIDPQIIQEEKGSFEQYSVIHHTEAVKMCVDIVESSLDAMVALLSKRTAGNLPINKILTHAIDYSTRLARPVFEKLEPHKLAEYNSSLVEVLKYAEWIQQRYKPEDDLVRVAHHLMFDYPSHSFVIDKEQLVALGFDVGDIDENVRKHIANNMVNGVSLFRLESHETRGNKKNGRESS